MNVESRSRVQSGIPSGGQFAAELHAEAGITLTVPSPLDTAAVAYVGDLVRTSVVAETGKWQRRMDGWGRDATAEIPLPPELIEYDRQAANFESLPRQEQEEVLDQLKLPNAKPLLEPGQQLGNDKVRIAEDLDTEGGNLGLALTAQKLVAESGIRGDITLTKIGNNTEFTVQDGNIQHTLEIGDRMLSFSATSGAAEDYDRDNWLCRADMSSFGGSIFEQDRAEELLKLHDGHREYAVMMDVVADSSFRHFESLIGELNREYRTAELKVDGTEYELDVSEDTPSLRGDGASLMHPSMVPGFLNHAATQTGHPDGDALAGYSFVNAVFAA